MACHREIEGICWLLVAGNMVRDLGARCTQEELLLQTKTEPFFRLCLSMPLLLGSYERHRAQVEILRTFDQFLCSMLEWTPDCFIEMLNL